MFIKQLANFKKTVLLSIVLIYLVILAGGIVRSTGSGMGCPDWPKCFGVWVPPTDVSQLPSNYKEKFKVGIHQIAEFNVFKTWVEYINRLLGVLVGVSVFVMFLLSLRFVNTHTSFFTLSTAIFVLTGLQGWIGAKVVATNLSKHMITVHMLIALVIVSLALFLFQKVSEVDEVAVESGFTNYMLALSVLTLIQVLVGTQVRQEIDTIAIKYQDANRNMWVSELGAMFSVHRVLAVLTIIANACIAMLFIKRHRVSHGLSKVVIIIVALLVFEYLFGVVMARYSIPFFVQPIHLFLATLVFGLQFYVWLVFKNSPRLSTTFVPISR